jgi:hypothetical protein
MRAVGRRNTSRLVQVAGIVSILVLALATSAWASHRYVEISIPVETIVRADQGSTTELETAQVPEDSVGHLCQVSAHAENQESAHPGNDLLVESGVSQVLLSDVEAEPNQVVEAEQMLELGNVISVSLIMGPDGVFSAGIEVQVECLPAETTTTIATTTTLEVSPTVVTTTTTIAETTTTSEVSDTEVTAPSTTTTIEDEVKGTEVLPFTGVDGSQVGLMALGLMASGALVLLAVRSRSEDH